ncbi:MAG: hypothetical protein D6722_26265 [Bacteroidetes bacterium]|nr:MAG: hypothetical protein D6722_26265 [Bacteroidota bacterium]
MALGRAHVEGQPGDVLEELAQGPVERGLALGRQLVVGRVVLEAAQGAHEVQDHLAQDREQLLVALGLGPGALPGARAVLVRGLERAGLLRDP